MHIYPLKVYPLLPCYFIATRFGTDEHHNFIFTKHRDIFSIFSILLECCNIVNSIYSTYIHTTSTTIYLVYINHSPLLTIYDLMVTNI